MRPVALTNPGGFTLIEVLIGSTVTLGLILVAMNLIDVQKQAVSILRTKITLDSIRIDLQSALEDSATCFDNLKPPFQFNPSRVGDALYTIPIAQLSEPGPPPRVLAQVGQALTDIKPELIVSAMHVHRLQQVAPNTYIFQVLLNITDRQNNYVSSVEIPARVVADPSSTSTVATVASCGSGGSTGAPSCYWSTATGILNLEVDAFCAPGEMVVTGGASCLFPDGTEWAGRTPLLNEVGYMITTRNVISGGVEGWRGDCYVYGWDMAVSKSIALCCRR